jgi:hypothetical protein
MKINAINAGQRFLGVKDMAVGNANVRRFINVVHENVAAAKGVDTFTKASQAASGGLFKKGSAKKLEKMGLNQQSEKVCNSLKEASKELMAPVIQTLIDLGYLV